MAGLLVIVSMGPETWAPSYPLTSPRSWICHPQQLGFSRCCQGTLRGQKRVWSMFDGQFPFHEEYDEGSNQGHGSCHQHNNHWNPTSLWLPGATYNSTWEGGSRALYA